MKIFKIAQHAERDKVIVGEAIDFPGDGTSTAWSELQLNQGSYLVQYAASSGKIALTAVPTGASYALQIEQNADLINTFTLGNNAYVLSYTRASGTFQVRQLFDTLSLGKALPFRRTHEPGVTAGFTTIGVFDQGNRVAFMGYDHESGRVAIFDAATTARGQDGGPPIAIQGAWSHMWATGWTRFAFFALGDETFFLKTNDIWHNVNIDHINRNHELGTNEVATRMTLVDAYDISLVAPLTLGHGDPYFVAYKPDGRAVVYRIHGDCTGWTAVAEFIAPAAAKGLHCFSDGPHGYVVLI